MADDSRIQRARIKSIEKDSRVEKKKKKEKVSPDKETGRAKQPEGGRSKSPEPLQRISSPEGRRKPLENTPETRRPPRAASRLKQSQTGIALNTSASSVASLGTAASLHSRPVNPIVFTPPDQVEPQRRQVEDKFIECDIFNRGTLINFLNDKVFSDLTLVGPDGTEYAVHRIVMAHASDWIHRQLSKDQSPGPWKVTIPFPDPSKVLPQVIRAVYTGQIEITSDSATAVNTLAGHLEIPSLLKQVAQYLTSTVQRHNCVFMLRQAIELQADDVARACLSIVARNFATLKEKDWNWLSYKHFLGLLQADFFQARSEMDVYELISGYIEAHRQNLSLEQIRELHEEIRYRYLTLDQMRATAQSPSAPVDLLLEGALARLEAIERKTGEMKVIGKNKRTRKRIAHGLQFPFTPELTMKGVIHFLATSSSLSTSKENVWTNPHEAGVLQITASSLERGDLKNLVADEPKELWTQAVPASWFCVDFKTRRVRPHHYSVRHGALHKTDILRHWDLLGSNDGKEWTLLRRHTADSSLREPFQTCTWEITKCEKSFRYFRVIQTGHNSSRHNFLALSGFELYGELFDQEEE